MTLTIWHNWGPDDAKGPAMKSILADFMAANPDKAGAIEASVARLMAPNGMGTRFKVIGVRDPSLPPLPGLEPVDSGRARA